MPQNQELSTGKIMINPKPDRIDLRKLPPSQIIRLAVADTIATAHNPDYILNMEYWHWPSDKVFGESANRCLTCLAGAVMVQRFDVTKRLSLYPSDFGSYKHVFNFLNEIRYEHPATALRQYYFNITKYQHQDEYLMVEPNYSAITKLVFDFKWELPKVSSTFTDETFHPFCGRMLQLADLFEKAADAAARHVAQRVS